MKRLLILSVMLAALSARIFAQGIVGDLRFRNYGAAAGLSSNTVNFVFADSKGFIWACTNSGINRFDAYSFRQFLHDPLNENSPAGNIVLNCAEDRNGFLWFGTANGVSRFDPRSEQWQHHLQPGSDRLFSKSTRFFCALGRDGRLWVSSNYHVSRYEPSANRFVHFPVFTGEGEVRNHNVYALFQDSKNRLWLPTSYGVQRLDEQARRLRAYHHPESNGSSAANAITNLFEDSKGNVFACTWGIGLLRYDEAADSFQNVFFHHPNERVKFFRNIVRAAAVVGGKLYAAAEGGLIIADEKEAAEGQTIFTYEVSEGNAASQFGLPSSDLKHAAADRFGNIWVAGRGLSMLDPHLNRFKLTMLQPDAQGREIGPTAFAPAANGYFFSTYELYRAGTRERPVPVALRTGFSDPDRAVIWDMQAAGDTVFLATNEGLKICSGGGKIIKSYSHDRADVRSIVQGPLWKIHRAHNGDIWIASLRHGVSCIESDAGTVRNFFNIANRPHSLIGVVPTGFAEDGAGNIWLGTENGKLYKLSTKGVLIYDLRFGSHKTEVSIHPFPFSCDKEGRVLFAAADGIYSFDGENRKLTKLIAAHFELAQGRSALIDAANNIWIAAANGLFRADPRTKRLSVFRDVPGLSGGDVNTMAQINDSLILIGGNGYITAFDPTRSLAARRAPAPVITELTVNGQSTPAIPDLRIPYRSSIGFEFSALAFSAAGPAEYSYRLEGAEAFFSQPSSRRSIVYTDLSPGNYVFRVKTRSSGDETEESATAFAFEVIRPFYLTWWFAACIILLIAASLLLLYRWRLKRVREMENLRMRIAADLHDDVGATLSSVAMYSYGLKERAEKLDPQMAAVLEKIGRNSSEMVTGMSDIVWAINPKNDSGDKLISRMRNFGGEICNARSIEFVFSAARGLETSHLSLLLRKNLFLIFKEAINNAVKYSGADKITVTLAHTHDRVQLSVRDNGHGLKPAETQGGNGMQSMRVRAAEIDGTFDLQSDSNNGTTISVSAPL